MTRLTEAFEQDDYQAAADIASAEFDATPSSNSKARAALRKDIVHALRLLGYLSFVDGSSHWARISRIAN